MRQVHQDKKPVDGLQFTCKRVCPALCVVWFYRVQGGMVRDTFNILDVQHRFLPAYGLSRSGHRLAPVAAQRARMAMSRGGDAAAKARVDAELQNRGGFIPLMGHFPVMRFAAAGQVDRAAEADVQQHALQEEDGTEAAEAAAEGGEGVEQEAVTDVVQQVEDGAQAGVQAAAGAGGVQFSDADKRMFVYMQQWWQKHKTAAKQRKRKRLKVEQDALGAAAAVAAVGEPMQVLEPADA